MCKTSGWKTESHWKSMGSLSGEWIGHGIPTKTQFSMGQLSWKMVVLLENLLDRTIVLFWGKDLWETYGTSKWGKLQLTGRNIYDWHIGIFQGSFGGIHRTWDSGKPLFSHRTSSMGKLCWHGHLWETLRNVYGKFMGDLLVDMGTSVDNL